MTIAQLIHDTAFHGKDAPIHSDAYKAGAMVALNHCEKLQQVPTDCQPYAPGTPDADAWWSGVRIGYQLWACYQLSLEEGAA